MTGTNQHELIDEQAAANRLALKVKTLQRWRWEGKGPQFVKLGGAVRYDITDLNLFIEASKRASTSMNVNVAV